MDSKVVLGNQWNIFVKISNQNFKNVLALKIHGLKHVAAVYYSNPLPPKKPAALKRKKMLKPKKRKKMYYFEWENPK